MIERLVSHRVKSLCLLASTFVLAGCPDDASLDPLPVSAQVNLAPAAYTLLSGAAVRGAVEFPATSTAREYLIVGQLATATMGTSSPFILGGQASAVANFRLTQLAARPNAALAFHAMLRRRDAELARRARLQGAALRAPPAATPPPVVGSQRTFKVCSNTDCDATKNVPATARFVGIHAAIFLDDSVPANGLTTNDLAQIGAQFDADLYPIDRDRFGTESDIDGNGVVIVVLTKQINALVPKPGCNDGFITGYFFSGDLLPGLSQFNGGEVFYGMVPDPAGSVSCAYSTSYVKRVVPVTFIHEFQHMISFNQHVLVRNGPNEVLWLNEAMSHLAEELGGLHYDSLGVDSTATRFLIGNLYNASTYLADPASVAVVNDSGNGSLEERGAGWLLLRYIMDRAGPGASRSLVQTSLTGGANIQAATGLTFQTVLGRWMLALYVNDLPGFSAPADLTYASWGFRTTFASLHTQDPTNFPSTFPLVPDSGNGSQAFAQGSVSAGTGVYLRVTQPANGPSFAMTFRGPDGKAMPASRIPQIAVVRIN